MDAGGGHLAVCDGTPLIVLADPDATPKAVRLVRGGAVDYLIRPVQDQALLLAVDKAIERLWKARETHRLRSALDNCCRVDRIISQDYRMARVFGLIDAVADAPQTTVLITGESGTGKSLVARTIHHRSGRAAGPFVEVTCGALPETLQESELFGHVKGSFTGAMADKQGKFAAADGGTIFLDEISTASPGLQVKLLRVMQDHRFEPVGSNDTISVDCRVILATNQDLWAEVAAGRFREDLYYRVNVITIELPPLRQRVADIPLLAEHFLEMYCRQSGREIEGFAPDAMDSLCRHAWPGNVRELSNCVERAVILGQGPFIELDDLPSSVMDAAAALPVEVAVHSPGQTLAEALNEPEKQIIRAALRANGGNRQSTADQLGINRATLYKKMKKYHLGGL